MRLKQIPILLIGLLSAFPLLASSKKITILPDQLKVIYDNFLITLKTNDVGAINQFCLPNSITYTYDKRKDTGFGPGYGNDINLYWIKNGFDGKIVSVRKDSENCYLIRTNSTAMWFVETKSTGWKLYKYLDKPIE